MTRVPTTALAISMILIVGYEITLRVLHPAVEFGQDQFSTNRIKLENYVDSANRPAFVLAGSSLTFRLPNAQLGNSWANLAIAGGSPVTILKIVDAMDRGPRRVLIEINLLDEGPDDVLVDGVVGSPWRQLRHLLRIARVANNPFNLLFWMLTNGRNNVAQAAPPNFLALLALQADAFSHGISKAAVSNINLAKSIVSHLQKKGVEVSFYEMPIDDSLKESSRVKELRSALEAAFDNNHYCWLSIDRGEHWHTSDGIHLLAADAAIAAQRLLHATCRAGDQKAAGVQTPSLGFSSSAYSLASG